MEFFFDRFVHSCSRTIFGWVLLLGLNTPCRSEELNSASEAKIRSQLLHEVIHGALQVMHRDFFKEEERSKIPSESLEDVFSELEKTWRVKVRWLAVDAKAMNIDHKPVDAFETRAVEAITGGAEMHDAREGNLYRYAGVISLGNRCLKCHVPDRTSLEERKAAVLITMPIDFRKNP